MLGIKTHVSHVYVFMHLLVLLMIDIDAAPTCTYKRFDLIAVVIQTMLYLQYTLQSAPRYIFKCSAFIGSFPRMGYNNGTLPYIPVFGGVLPK